MILNFELPRKPVASPRPKVAMLFGRPKAYFPKNYTVEKKIISDLFLNDFGGELAYYKGNLEVSIEFCFPFPEKSFKGYIGSKSEIIKEIFCGEPHNSKPDLDNLAKTYLDSLNGIAWYDDSSVSKLTLSKKWGYEPMVYMTINYTDINKVSEIELDEDKRILKERELINKIYEERKKSKGKKKQ